MENKIDLPVGIEKGTEILVRDDCCMTWVPAKYVCVFNNKVFVEDKESEMVLLGYDQGKMKETNWNEVPIDTKVAYWDDDYEEKRFGYLVAVINGVPFCNPCETKSFTQEKSNRMGGLCLHSWEHVEIVKEN